MVPKQSIGSIIQWGILYPLTARNMYGVITESIRKDLNV